MYVKKIIAGLSVTTLGILTYNCNNVTKTYIPYVKLTDDSVMENVSLFQLVKLSLGSNKDTLKEIRINHNQKLLDTFVYTNFLYNNLDTVILDNIENVKDRFSLNIKHITLINCGNPLNFKYHNLETIKIVDQRNSETNVSGNFSYLKKFDITCKKLTLNQTIINTNIITGTRIKYVTDYKIYYASDKEFQTMINENRNINGNKLK